MRLQCSVDIHNRACAVAGVATLCKPTHAQVSIGKKPGSNKELYLMVATTKDLNGRKFPLKSNVVKAFTRFVPEGKVTIQLKEPAFDIRIAKADPRQLKVSQNAGSGRAVRDEAEVFCICVHRPCTDTQVYDQLSCPLHPTPTPS